MLKSRNARKILEAVHTRGDDGISHMHEHPNTGSRTKPEKSDYFLTQYYFHEAM
jgi:hypothetical protein